MSQINGLHHEEVEIVGIGKPEAANLDLVSVPKKKVQKSRSKFLLTFGGIKKPSPMFFTDILKKAEGLSHPYLLFDYADNELLICECKDINDCPVPYIEPDTKDEKNGISFFVASCIHGKDQAGIRVDSMKDAFSTDFGTVEGVKLWLGAPPSIVAQLLP